MKKYPILMISMMSCVLLLLGACSSETAVSEVVDKINEMSTEEIEQKAREEGSIESVGMPDDWANWVSTWKDINDQYGIDHTDTDMSSAEELANFLSSENGEAADIGDVGIAFGPYSVEKQAVFPYKTSYWDEVPDWAKDDKGNWMLSYTGTMAFLVDTDKVKEIPHSWKELKDSKYRVTIGDVASGNQDQFAVLAAALANGGDESNIQPGLDYFKSLNDQGRLFTTGADAGTLEAGEHEVVPMWDFNALTMQESIGESRFKVVIPTDGAVTSGYTTILNRNAPHPYAAALAREYILSDQGQNNLAKGHARPIRENVELDDEAKSALLPDSEYQNVYHIKDIDEWNSLLEEIGKLWQEEVLS